MVRPCSSIGLIQFCPRCVFKRGISKYPRDVSHCSRRFAKMDENDKAIKQILFMHPWEDNSFTSERWQWEITFGVEISIPKLHCTFVFAPCEFSLEIYIQLDTFTAQAKSLNAKYLTRLSINWYFVIVYSMLLNFTFCLWLPNSSKVQSFAWGVFFSWI